MLPAATVLRLFLQPYIIEPCFSGGIPYPKSDGNSAAGFRGCGKIHALAEPRVRSDIASKPPDSELPGIVRDINTRSQIGISGQSEPPGSDKT